MNANNLILLPLIQGTIGAASNLNNSKQQEQILDQVKSVTESALQLIYSTKDCGGNPKVSSIFSNSILSSSASDVLTNLFHFIDVKLIWHKNILQAFIYFTARV